MARGKKPTWTFPHRVPDGISVYKPAGSSDRTRWYVAYRPHRRAKRVVERVSANTRVTLKRILQIASDQRDAELDARAARLAREARKPATQHLDEYRQFLLDEGVTEKQADQVRYRAGWVLDHHPSHHGAARLGITHVSEISPSGAKRALGHLREKGSGGAGRKPASKRTSNHYLRAVKQFTAWLAADKRIAEDPIKDLEAMNWRDDVRHARQDLGDDASAWLIAAALSGQFHNHLAGADRAMLYETAIESGFRGDELATLTPRRCKLDAPHPMLVCKAGYSKHRREDHQPIRREFAARLKRYLEGKSIDQPIWQVPNEPVDLIKPDLRRARAMWIKETCDRADRRRRRESDFLCYVDAEGRHADFHALRHTYICRLVRAGVMPKECQMLARHASITTTMDYYAHLRLHDTAGAVNRVPGLGENSRQREALAATGTDGKAQRDAQRPVVRTWPSLSKVGSAVGSGTGDENAPIHQQNAVFGGDHAVNRNDQRAMITQDGPTTMGTDCTQTEHATFLDALFGAMPEHRHILLFTLPDRRSFWPTSAQKAAELVPEIVAGHDVYVGVGISPKAYGPSHRCKAADIAGIGGLWADVDVLGPNHKKTNLPPDLDAATALLAKMPLAPTVVVASGGGLQAWWLFNEPWMFDTDPERAKAETLEKAWLAMLRSQAQASGWDIDATHDLARVMRLPGTLNHKSDPPREVKIVHADGPRFEPSDFEQFVTIGTTITPPPPAIQAHAETIGPLAIDANAQPPWTKLMQLFNDEPLAMASFSYNNPSLKDQSPSSYDFSIANYLVRRGFSDQEITDALIYARKQARHEPKLRLDYYQRTIAKVRADVNVAERQDAARHFLHTHDPAPAATPVDLPAGADKSRDDIVNHLSTVIGTRILAIIKFTKDPPEYLLKTQAGEVELGTVEGLINQRKFRNAVAAAQGHYMPGFASKEWDRIAQWLLNIVEIQDCGPEATDRGVVRAWLAEYIDNHPPCEISDNAISQRMPFVDEDGIIYIFGPMLRNFLLRRNADKISPKEMGKLLRKAGCRSKVINRIVRDKQVGRMVWQVPGTVLEDAKTG